MNDYYIDTEYCPISEEEDVLGTGESLERYGQILLRARLEFEKTLPYVSQNGNELDLKVWKEVGDMISAYLGVIEQIYPQLESAGLWLARIPAYDYLENKFETREQALLCVIIDCTYYNRQGESLRKNEVDARYRVGFYEDAQQKFIDALEEIWVKFELHLNLIDSLVDWEERLESSNSDGFKILFSDLPNGQEMTLKSVITGIDAWMRCRSSEILPLWKTSENFPNLNDIVEEISRDL
ncbi:hypothetical protein TWF506_006806 [Arthrobotrys conoides]|uniref:Uncharacterized protein n=1 Tax=Arthrobotrys conoides TaxID=74498 RepID=A0AAN8NRY3_9PEZI